MPQPAPAPCLHELRPGTKVCLHCRRAAREARVAHRNSILGRIAIVAIALGVVAAGARAGLDAFRRGSLPEIPALMAATTKAIVESLPGTPATSPAPQQSTSLPAALDSTGQAVATDVSPAPLQAPVAGPTMETVSLTTPALAMPALSPPASVPSPTPATTPVPPPAATPTIPDGRTELDAGMYAIRSGDTITVFFDTPDARTRRADKFEQIVRATLPLVHGTTAQATLGAVAPGALVGTVDLLNDLPTRGLHLRTSDGRALSLWPETRPGRDGPLVVSYRAVLSR